MNETPFDYKAIVYIRRWNHGTYGPEITITPTEPFTTKPRGCHLCGYSHRTAPCSTGCTAKFA